MKKTTQIIASILFLIIWIYPSNAQVLIPPMVKTSNGVSTPEVFRNRSASIRLNIDQYIMSLTANGVLNFNRPSGLFRLILHDNKDGEYLIYENLAIYNNLNEDISLSNVSNETAFLPNIKPVSIEVIADGCEYRHSSIQYGTGGISNDEMNYLRYYRLVRSNIINKEIKRINDYNRSHKVLWIARRTPLSDISFKDKKAMYGIGSDDRSLIGIEHYAGGIYHPAIGILKEEDFVDNTTYPYVESFDWRNRHGINWDTPCKIQAGPKPGTYAPACWAFSIVSNLESYIKLATNGRLSVDLSEQELISCSNGMVEGKDPTEDPTAIYGGHMDVAARYIKNNGITTERCFPYAKIKLPCESKCANIDSLFIPSQLFQSGMFYSNPHMDRKVIMRDLIHKGPLALAHFSDNVGGHAMSLVGYAVIRPGKMLIEWEDDYIDIPADHPAVGKVYWIFKNSGGDSWGNQGYSYILRLKNKGNVYSYFRDYSYFSGGFSIASTGSSPREYSRINAVDEDNDGYYRWGLGLRPDDPNIPMDQDGDDSDAAYGPMNEFGILRALRPFDLYIKDTPMDKGVEPNGTKEPLWESPDIWIRNQNDAIEEHENPEYVAGKPVYVKVRIRNKGVKPSLPSLKLSVYWSQAGISLDRGSFVGTHQIGDLTTGGRINKYTIPIPSIPAGGNVVISVPWEIKDPKLYAQYTKEPWHYCLLAEINGQDDPYHNISAEPFARYVADNNNVAWKNLTIIETSSSIDPNDKISIGGAISLYNTKATAQRYNVEIQEVNRRTVPLATQAEISIRLDENLRKAWISGGSRLSALKPSMDQLVATGDEAQIGGIYLLPNGTGVMDVKFNFLTKKLTEQNSFTYRVTLKDADTGEVIGGETYIIRKKPRRIFNAEIKIPTTGALTTIYKAEDIGEPAKYRWIGDEDRLLATGTEFTPESGLMPKKLTLEVTAEKDGFKDYAYIQPDLAQSSHIISISPNPANDVVDISFEVPNTAEVQLVLTSVSSGSGYVYTIPNGVKTYRIDLSAFPSGNYVLNLLLNKQVTDTKMMTKN